MKKIQILLLILIIIGIGLLLTQKSWVPKLVNKILKSENSNISNNSNQIIYPRGGEELVTGETYSLKWVADSDKTHIFLIDTSLKSAGASVSISDRVYDIENTGSYEYTIPEHLKPGIYELQIGNKTSNTFRVKNDKSTEPTSENLELKIGDTATSMATQVTLNKLISDSRCPKDVYCITAGFASFEVKLKNTSTKETITLASNQPAQKFDNILISIVDVSPAQISTTPTQSSQYEVTLKLEQDK